MTDFRFTDHGSICILTPVSPSAIDWVNDHISDERPEYAGGIVIEPRYASDIIDGIIADYLTISL
jgi:hypothetical protein